MIAVIAEVWAKATGKQAYLDIAAELRPLLSEIDGFISIERFESLYEPGKILSLSFWRDEEAIEKARAMNRKGLKCEIWNGERLVATLHAQDLAA